VAIAVASLVGAMPAAPATSGTNGTMDADSAATTASEAIRRRMGRSVNVFETMFGGPLPVRARMVRRLS